MEAGEFGMFLPPQSSFRPCLGAMGCDCCTIPTSRHLEYELQGINLSILHGEKFPVLILFLSLYPKSHAYIRYPGTRWLIHTASMPSPAPGGIARTGCIHLIFFSRETTHPGLVVRRVSLLPPSSPPTLRENDGTEPQGKPPALSPTQALGQLLPTCCTMQAPARGQLGTYSLVPFSPDALFSTACILPQPIGVPLTFNTPVTIP